jgi:hypothetical protein
MGLSDKGAGRLNVWRRGAKRHFPVYKHALMFNLSENRVVVGAQCIAPLREITCFEQEP